MLDSLTGSSKFSVLVPVLEPSRLSEWGKPASDCLYNTLGLYWLKRIPFPFGLSAAPAELQRKMGFEKKKCLIGLRDVMCQSYLEDNLVHIPSFEDHISHMWLCCKGTRNMGWIFVYASVRCLKGRWCFWGVQYPMKATLWTQLQWLQCKH